MLGNDNYNEHDNHNDNDHAGHDNNYANAPHNRNARRSHIVPLVSHKNEKHQTSAGIVLFRKEGSDILFLLLRHPAGHWDFAKGKIEKGESARQTAVRETWEETGITDINFVDDFESSIKYDFKRKGMLIHKTVIFFLAETSTKDISLSHEHIDYTWMDYDSSINDKGFKLGSSALLEKIHAILDH